MNLEELIAVLTTAKEQATEGEWSGDCGIIGRNKSDRLPWIHLGSCYSEVDGVNGEANAQSIATRHNTGSMVLQQLRRVEELTRERDEAREKCKRLEISLQVERMAGRNLMYGPGLP